MGASLQLLCTRCFVCFVLSLFRLFVYKPVRLTMPVCVLSCAYCCHGVSVPLLTSTRCKVETIAADRVPCICTGLTPVALPVAFNTTPSPNSPLTFNLCSKDLVCLSCRDKAEGVCPPPQSLLTGVCENLLLLSFS